MTEAMPFLQKAILLSYDPRPFVRGRFRMRESGGEANRALRASGDLERGKARAFNGCGGPGSNSGEAPRAQPFAPSDGLG